MAKILKGLLLLLVICAMVWLSTLWRWQTMHADPSGQDVLVHLVLLPLALTAALLLAIWVGKKIRALLESPKPPQLADKRSDKLSEPKTPVGADLNLTHHADPILTRGWMPTT